MPFIFALFAIRSISVGNEFSKERFLLTKMEDQVKPSTFFVNVKDKTEAHPWFNEGSKIGYSVNGVEGGAIVAERGSTITIDVDALGHPFYFTTDSTGGSGFPGNLMGNVKPVDNGTIRYTLTGVPSSFYYQCGRHLKMGGKVTLLNGTPHKEEPFSLNKVYDNKAVSVLSPMESDEIYIVQQGGLIYVDRGKGAELFFDIRDRLVTLGSEYDERGLLDMAFHPSYKDGHGKFYLFYSHGGSKVGYYNRLSMFVSIGWKPTSNSEKVIFRVYRESKIHNGGRILVDGGYIYLTLGDGGPQQVPLNRAQDLSVVHGKVLRFKDSGAIPCDNPFTNVVSARNEIYSYGLRNPWGISKTPYGIFVVDVGHHDREEVNILQGGNNYGWNAKEGTKVTGYGTLRRGMVDPIYEFKTGHFPSLDLKVDSSAIIGGYYIEGVGYVFADYSGVLVAIDNVDDQWILVYSQRIEHGKVRSMGMVGNRLMVLCDSGIYEVSTVLLAQGTT